MADSFLLIAHGIVLPRRALFLSASTCQPKCLGTRQIYQQRSHDHHCGSFRTVQANRTCVVANHDAEFDKATVGAYDGDDDNDNHDIEMATKG